MMIAKMEFSRLLNRAYEMAFVYLATTVVCPNHLVFLLVMKECLVRDFTSGIILYCPECFIVVIDLHD